MKTSWGTSIKDLTAPEAHFLVHGPPSKLGNASEAFEKSILELVGRGWLSIRESPQALQTQLDVRFIRGKRTGAPQERPLLAAFALFEKGFSEGWAPDDGLPGFVLWRLLNAHYGSLSSFADAEVMTSLRDRNLYERSGTGLIGMFLRGGWRRTRTGDRLRVEVQDTLAQARQKFPGWVREKPEKALEFLERSGAIMVLVPSIYPEISSLAGVHRVNRAKEGSEDPEWIDLEIFDLLAALSEVLSTMRKSYSDGSGEGAGFGGMWLGDGGDSGDVGS